MQTEMMMTENNDHKTSDTAFYSRLLLFLRAKNSESPENLCHSWMNHCWRIELLPQRVFKCTHEWVHSVCLCSHSSSPSVMVYMHPAELRLDPSCSHQPRCPWHMSPLPIPTPEPLPVTTNAPFLFCCCGPPRPPSPLRPPRPRQHKRCHRGLKIAL